MPPPTKRRRQLASITKAREAAKRQKSTLMEEDQGPRSCEYEGSSDSEWEVDESGDSDVSSDSDSDEREVLSIARSLLHGQLISSTIGYHHYAHSLD